MSGGQARLQIASKFQQPGSKRTGGREVFVEGSAMTAKPPHLQHCSSTIAIGKVSCEG